MKHLLLGAALLTSACGGGARPAPQIPTDHLLQGAAAEKQDVAGVRSYGKLEAPLIANTPRS